VYPASLVQNSRNRRPSLNVDYKNSETVSAQDINYFQIGGDNQRAGSGLQDHMATRSFRGNAFANCADPQLWLQAFRDQSTTGGSGAHKRLFCEINNSAFNNTFVTSRYKASDRNVPCVHDMRAQFKVTAQLYYEHVILNNEVPDGVDTSKLKHINLLPIRLVSRLGFLERLRNEPAAGARELVTAQKRKATAAGKNKPALSKTNQWEAASKEFSGLKKNGEPARKRGPKGGKRLSLSMDGGFGSSHATPNSAVLARGDGGGGSSSGSSSGSSNFLQLDSLEVNELKNQVTQQAALITQLQGQLREFDTHTQVKCGQFEAELRNRKNIAHLSAQCSVALEPEQIDAMMTDISPMKRPKTDKS
jgi:hypothetical protein